MKSKINKFFVWLIVFLLVIGLAGFGLQDVVSRWGTSRIATVGDIEISTEDFRRDLIQEINYFSQFLNKPITMEEAKSMGIHLRTLERIVNKSLLDQMLKDMGLSTGDIFLIKSLKSDSNFQDPSGEFNRKNYQQYLDRLNLSENQFEKILRADVSRNLILQTINGNFRSNSNISKLIADHAGEERLISIYKAREDIVDIKKPLIQKNVEKFFELNKETYQTKEIKKLSFISLDPDKLANQIEFSEEKLLEAFNSRKDEYNKPERKKLQRIVFSDKAEAETSYEQIKAGYKTFDQIAQRKHLNSQELAYGTFARNDLPVDLRDLVFSEDIKVGSVIGPVLGELGYEILQINKVFPAENLGFEKIRDRLNKELSVAQALETILSITPEIEDMIAAGESLETISQLYSLQIDSLDWFMGIDLPENFDTQEFNDLANIATTENSDLIELNSGILITMRLDEELKPYIPELTDIFDQVSNDYSRSEKLLALEETVTKILSKSSVSNILKSESFHHLFKEKINRRSVINYLEQDALEEIFQSKMGDLIVKPISKGANPYLIIIKIEEIIPASQNLQQYEKIKGAIQDQITEQTNNDRIIALINSLRELYKPTVNLKLVEQLVSNLQ